MRLIYVGWGKIDGSISYVSGLSLDHKVRVDDRWGSEPRRAPRKGEGLHKLMQNKVHFSVLA